MSIVLAIVFTIGAVFSIGCEGFINQVGDNIVNYKSECHAFVTKYYFCCDKQGANRVDDCQCTSFEDPTHDDHYTNILYPIFPYPGDCTSSFDVDRCCTTEEAIMNICEKALDNKEDSSCFFLLGECDPKTDVFSVDPNRCK